MPYPKQPPLFGEKYDALTVAQYQEAAQRTDRGYQAGDDPLEFPLLGLAGEVGSLLAALKKKHRDQRAFLGYQDIVIEEFGDVLWYLSTVASRANLALAEIAADALQGDPTGTRPDPETLTLFALQGDFEPTGPARELAHKSMLRLAAHLGALISNHVHGRFDRNPNVLRGDFVHIIRGLVEAANQAGISVAEAALKNIHKTESIFPADEDRKPHAAAPLVDADELPEEQLPRRIEVAIRERPVIVRDENGKPQEDPDRRYVYLESNGVIVGDRLTDNSLEDDDYRFHDVFHLAFAAVLGWSPVTRALLRRKRKSDPKVDEVQDGARAILIEEGISTWIFNHAKKLHFFEDLERLDLGLLKTVSEFTVGYEPETYPLWLWEDAIKQGYAVFREIIRKDRRGGYVVADLEARTITVEELEE